MELFLGQRVPRGDARLKNVYRNFRVNISDIANRGRRCGAQVLLATIPVNLERSPPFASLHRAGLVAADLQKWEQNFNEGRRAQAEGHSAEALAAYERAAKIDADYAELVFVRAQIE